jgi:ElaA protein
VQEALARCRHDYADHAVMLTGQTYLTPFYESLGFAVTSAPYDDYGLRHVDMILPAGTARHSGTAEGRTRNP